MGQISSYFRFRQKEDELYAEDVPVGEIVDEDKIIDAEYEHAEDAIDRAKRLEEIREQRELEEQEKNIDFETRQDMLGTFFNHTVGSVFVWTFDTTGVAVAVWGIYEVLLVASREQELYPIFFFWSALCMLITALTMATLVLVRSFVNRMPGIFTRHYLMITQACCGCVSVVSTTFTSTAWHAVRNDGQWRDIFFPTNRAYLVSAVLVMVVGQNVLWAVSAIATYACTPYGESNSAFLHLPVVAGLTVMYILVASTGDSRLLVCTGPNANIGAFALTNVGIFTSFLLDWLSAVEYDPGFRPEDSAHRIRRYFHSTLTQKQRIDPYGLLHGLAIFTVLMVYVADGKPSDTMAVTALVLVLFLSFVMLVQCFDLQWLVSQAFEIDDPHERDVLLLQRAFSLTLRDAEKVLLDIEKTQVKSGTEKTEPGKASLGARDRWESNSVTDSNASSSPPSSPNITPNTGGMRMRRRHSDADVLMAAQQQAARFARRPPRPLMTGFDAYPNIPMTLRRTVT